MKPISMLATEAKTKRCPFTMGNCLAGGCMAWGETETGALSLGLPWPDDIKRPKAEIDPFNTSPQGTAIKLRDAALKALSPMVGQAHGSGRITQVKPADYQLTQITVTVIDDALAKGHCRHFQPQP